MNSPRTRLVLLMAAVSAGALLAATVRTRTIAQPPVPNDSGPTDRGTSAPPDTVLPLTSEAAAVLTETVGLLSGLQLYQTYLNIGMLADIRAEGLYEAGELAYLLGSVVTPLEQVDKQLEKIAGLKGLSKDDAAALARMRKIVGLLQTQGKSLQAFWDTGVEDHGQKYEAARQAAWKEIDDLLGLTVREGVAPEPRPVEPKP